MGQSVFVWIFVFDDGTTKTVRTTWDGMWEKLPEREPVAVIRGEMD